VGTTQQPAKVLKKKHGTQGKLERARLGQIGLEWCGNEGRAVVPCVSKEVIANPRSKVSQTQGEFRFGGGENGGA